MPVFKRGSTWWITVTHNGQRLRQSAGKGATQSQAKEIEAKLRGDIHAQRVGRAPSRTIDAALTRWLGPGGEASRLKSYDNLLEKVATIRAHVRGKALTDIVLAANAVREAGIRAGLKPATINRRLAILRRVANLAFKEWQWLDQPLGQRIKMVPGETHRAVFLSPKEVEKIAAACPSDLAGDAIRLAAYTGLRRSELLGLSKANIHGGEVHLSPKTKSGKPRIVPVPRHIRPLLAKVPLAITERELRRNFEVARAAAKLPDARFHDLRHAYASWLIQNGADLQTVRDLLGHSTIAVTADIYAHLLTSHLKKAVDRLPAPTTKPVTRRSQQASNEKGE